MTRDMRREIVVASSLTLIFFDSLLQTSSKAFFTDSKPLSNTISFFCHYSHSPSSILKSQKTQEKQVKITNNKSFSLSHVIVSVNSLSPHPTKTVCKTSFLSRTIQNIFFQSSHIYLFRRLSIPSKHHSPSPNFLFFVVVDCISLLVFPF